MKGWNLFSDMLMVSVTSAAPEHTLNAIIRQEISISGLVQCNDLTYRFSIRRQDLSRLDALIRRLDGKLEILQNYGICRFFRRLRHRPVLVSLIAFLLTSAVFLPTRVLFVRVEGNQILPARQILDAAENCGVRFGASRKLVRSEKVKNALLEQLPKLQWSGVNTRGCTAVISVRERSEESDQQRKEFSNLIASQDGYILSQVVLRGTPMVIPGESVTKGQLLISGYTDCGICIRTGRAEGEVLAQTSRNLAAITPKTTGTIGEITDRKYKISLLLRKKRINLWKDSRISDTGCGRMYEEYYVSLPGGFRLPIAICIDQYLEYRIAESAILEEDAMKQLQSFSDRYLLQQTVAGQVLKKQQQLLEANGCYMLKSRYICTEMIGKEQEEQMGDTNEQGN